jgi:hypothetical protein
MMVVDLSPLSKDLLAGEGIIRRRTGVEPTSHKTKART